MLARLDRHSTKSKQVSLPLAVLILLVGPMLIATLRHAPLPRTDSAIRSTTSIGALPLAFEPNAGQVAQPVRFLAHSSGATLAFTSSGVALTVPQPQSQDLHTQNSPGERGAAPQTVNMTFIGSNPSSEITSGDTLTGKVNYFIGKDPAQWHTNLPTYSGITYSNLYPGITLAYGGADGQLKGTYTLASGADPNLIRWSYAGAETMGLDYTGNLQIAVQSKIQTPKGHPKSKITLTEHAPQAWQTIEGARVAVASRYTIDAAGTIGFELGSYDHSQPLTIDPSLTYSTYLGGFFGDGARGIGLDAAGNIYVAGTTSSPDFPTAGNPYQPIYAGELYDTFVSKISADGSTLVYSTFLGGNDWDTGGFLAVDSAGIATVAGVTSSTNFPITPNAYQTAFGGNEDGFVTRLNADGSDLVYSTYYGGCCTDELFALATDSAGNAYVTGYTFSPDMPTANPFQPECSLNCFDSDAFVGKLSADGTQLLYGTFLGGSANDGTDINDWGLGITADSNGFIYAVGTTRSPNFPVANAYQPIKSGFEDAFVTKINPSVGPSQQLAYSTFLGGAISEYAFGGVAVDAAGNAYVAGQTSSANFPVLNAVQATYGGSRDAFVTEFNPSGSALIFSTYLGGNNEETPGGIMVNGAGKIYVVGRTSSPNFPILNPLQGTLRGASDAFVTKFNSSGATLSYSTFFGGTGGDGAGSVILNPGGDVAYIAGGTGSTDFPLVNPVQATNHGSGDAFIAAISDAAPLTATPTRTGTPPTATPTSCVPGATSWRNEPSITEARDYGIGAAVGGKLYVIGGQRTGREPPYVEVVERFDPATGTWDTVAPIPIAAKAMAATAVGNKIYVAGGYTVRNGFTINLMQIYDVATNTWTQGAPVPVRLQGAAAAAYNGKVYIFGGGESTARDTVFEYDPATDSYATKAPMPRAEDQIGAATVGNRMYVVGGFRHDQYTHYAYDPVANTWSTIATPPTISFGWPGAFELNGELWVVGGYDNFARRGYPPSQEVQIYNPTANNWRFGPAFNTPRSRSRAAGAINGRGYVAGGVDLNDGSVLLTSVESITYSSCATSTATATSMATSTRTATAAFTATRTITTTPIRTVTAIVSQTATSTAVVTSVATSSGTVGASTATGTAMATATATACAISFSDVPQGSTFYTYIHCLACRGVLGGYDDGTFRPLNSVTRGQAAKILANAAAYDDDIPANRQTFNDVAPGSTFWLYVERVALHGAIGGYECGGEGEPCPGAYFRPQNNLTRGQLAKIAANTAGFTDDIPADRRSFNDVAPGSTFWLYVERVALHGAIGGYECGGDGEPCPGAYFRPQNDVTRGQTSKIVANTFFPGCALSRR